MDHRSEFGVHNPQTNGKLEKWFDTYQRFRGEFESFEEFA
jgi:hypothetical protein